MSKRFSIWFMLGIIVATVSSLFAQLLMAQGGDECQSNVVIYVNEVGLALETDNMGTLHDELRQLLAQQWGCDDEKLDSFDEDSRSNIVNQLKQAEADIAIGIEADFSEKGNILYSQMAYQGQLAILVKTEVSTLTDLAERQVFMAREPTLPIKEKFEQFTQRKALSITLDSDRNYEQALDIISNDDNYVGLVGDSIRLVDIANQTNDLKLLDIGEPIPISCHVIAVETDRDKLKTQIDEALAELATSDGLDNLINQQFPNAAGTPPVFMTLEECEDSLNRPILPPNSEEEPVSPTEPITQPPARTPVVQRIKETGVLRVGVKADAPPFGSLNANEELEGFEIDLINALANQCSLISEVQFVTVTSDDRIRRLLNGDIDLIAATMTHNKMRDRDIEFSQTYYLDGQNILVRQTFIEENGLGGQSDEVKIAALADKKIGAIKGSTSINQIKLLAAQQGVLITMAKFENYSQGIASLQLGDIDGLTTDRGILLGLQSNNPDLAILLTDNFSQEPYGFGLPAGDAYFMDWVNAALQELKRSGQYDEIYRRYFSNKPYDVEIIPDGKEYSYDCELYDKSSNLNVPSVLDKLVREQSFTAGFILGTLPFGGNNEDGEPIGFDVDLMREFAKRWLGDPEAVNFVDVSAEERFRRLRNGDVDILSAATTRTKARELIEEISFSQSYYETGQNIIARRDDNLKSETDAKTLQRLAGKRIGILAGTTSRFALLAEEAGVMVEIVDYEGLDEALPHLLSKQIDAISIDESILIGFAQKHPDELEILLDDFFSQEPYGLGIRKHDHRFRDLVNFTLQEIKADGTYDRLYRKWFQLSVLNILVNRDSMQQMESYEERIQSLNGKKVAIDLDEISQAEMEAYAEANNVQVEIVPSNEKEALEALLSQDNKVDAYVTEWQKANQIRNDLNHIGQLDILSDSGFSLDTPYNIELWPAGKGFPLDLSPMVYIPPGEFTLGWPRDSRNRIDEVPTQTVFLDEFYINQYEVTNRLYRQCINSMEKCTEPNDDGNIFREGPEYFTRFSNHPVAYISWSQASAYCETYDSTLPAEAQWEKAARGDVDTRLYPWGNDETEAIFRAAYANNSIGRPPAVGSYPLGGSPYNVHDLVGSVTEWTQDCYERSWYSYLEPSVDNPVNLSCGTNSQPERIVRGSSWLTDGNIRYALRITKRGKYLEDSAYAGRGFRCASSLRPIERPSFQEFFRLEN